MYSFNGRFAARLDDKNRMRIPAKYKADLETGYKLAFGPDKNIYVLPNEEYKKILDSFKGASIFDTEVQDAIAEFTSTVFDVCEDNQGRFILPGELKEYAEIDKEIVIVGAATYLRIESAERFAEKSKGRNIAGVFAKLKGLKAGQEE